MSVLSSVRQKKRKIQKLKILHKNANAQKQNEPKDAKSEVTGRRK